MGKLQYISRAAKVAAPFVIKAAPAIMDQINKINAQQKEKKKDYIKIPDVVSLPVDEATEVLTKYHFNYSLIKLPADKKYAMQLANTIVKMTPKGGSNVDPTTFIKIYYLDEVAIDQSLQDHQATMNEKSAKKAKHKEQIKKVAGKANVFSKH